MQQSKKRALIIDGPLGAGGAERVLIDILRNFDYDRYEVDLAVICRGGALMDEVPEQVNVIELWRGYNLSYKLAIRLSKWLHCNWLLARKMNGWKLRRAYDLEISFLEGMPTKLGALRTTKAKKAAWVHADLYTHRYEAAQFYAGEEKRAYDSMDYVVNVSKDCEKAFRKRFPECNAELRVIYNPIDRKKILRMAEEEPVSSLREAWRDKVIIMGMGRMTEVKNPRRFIEIAQIAQKEGRDDMRFVWLGAGPLANSMENIVREKRLENIVELYGFASNPYALLKDAFALAIPSDSEGFSLVACEAMCLGVPVISTRTAGPEEIIGKNEYGILTDLSAEAMFEALKRLADNPKERCSLAQKALSRPDRFSVDQTLKGIYDLI